MSWLAALFREYWQHQSQPNYDFHYFRVPLSEFTSKTFATKEPFCSLAYMNAQLNLPITKYTQHINQLHKIMCLITLTTLRGLLTFILFLPYSKSKTSNNNKIKMWNVCLNLQITSTLGLLFETSKQSMIIS